jgi:integrase
VADLDAGTVAVLRAHRKARGGLALALVRDTSLILGGMEGAYANPGHVSRQFARDCTRCCADVADLPKIRLHDLRHTHATLLPLAREPVHVVSQRLGHASPVVTMTIYAESEQGQSTRPCSAW